MKKTYLLLSLALLTLAGCTKQNTPVSSVSSSEEVSSETPKDYFSLDVKKEDGSVFNEEGTYGKWCTSSSCLMPYAIVNGHTENPKIKETSTETYYVHIDGLDEKYVYDPNVIATSDNRHTVITVYELKSYDETKTLSIGAYSVTLTEPKEKVEFTLLTPNAGTYTVESWLDMNAITNPETASASPKIYDGDTLLDNDSGFGNNFKYSFTASGESLTFSLSGDKAMSYNFIVTYQA